MPFEVGEVVFYYNKKLFEKAGVKAEDVKSWDDFLAAVKKLKAAGITPLVVGAGEKWPMHFYYSYLVMRIGGEHALADAKAGKDGGFKNAAFVEAGKRLRELAALEPFQPGYLQTTHAASAGLFGDGKAAMDLMGQWLLGMQAPNSASGKGLPEDDIGILSFPVMPGGKGKATDTLGGINGWLVAKSAPPEAVDFLKFFSQSKYGDEAAKTGGLYPGREGRGDAFHQSAVQAPRRRSRRDDLSSELLRSGSRALGRPRHQRRLGRGRRRRNDAGSRRRRDPGRGRPAMTRSTAPLAPLWARAAAEPSFVRASRRRMSANGWATLVVFLPPALLLFTIFVALPMAEAGWYGFYNWNGYGRPEKFVGLKNYQLLIGNATFLRSLVNNGLIIVVSLVVQLPLALGVALMVAGPDRRRRLVPHDLLPALHPRRRGGGADLAFHVRRRLRPAFAGHRRPGRSRPIICSPTRPGRSAPC